MKLKKEHPEIWIEKSGLLCMALQIFIKTKNYKK